MEAPIGAEACLLERADRARVGARYPHPGVRYDRISPQVVQKQCQRGRTGRLRRSGQSDTGSKGLRVISPAMECSIRVSKS